MDASKDTADVLPLAGVRALDLAEGSLGAVGRVLAELGADVLRIEPPGGGGDRRAGPSAGGDGLGFIAANLGKRAVAIDLADPQGQAAFRALASAADILIETTRPGSPQAARLDLADLRTRSPSLVVLSLSDFGPGGYADWRATDSVLHALSGELSRSGIPDREPLLPPGQLAIQCAAAQAVYAVLVAYLARLQTGTGDHLDLSLLDGAAQALDPGYGMAGSATSGTPASQLPRGRPEARHQYPILPCKDGYVRLCILAKRQWQGMFEWMGRPAEFADPKFDDLRVRFATPTLIPAITAFFADKTRAQIEAESQRHRVPASAVLSLAEVLETEHMRVRHAFTEVEVAPGVTAPFPNGAVVIDGERAGVRGAAPPADLPVEPALAAWREPRAPTSEVEFGAPGRPLAGLRVLDLGVIVAGGEQGRVLADFGAEVIKLENAAFPDGARASSAGGMSAGFAAGHRNKRGLGLNLRDPRGRELFLRLAEQADVVVSNFKPGTMASLGLSDETLLARNPRLVLADSSAFGATGPWSARMGYGPLVRAAAGLTSQWTYPGEPGSFSDAMTVYPDHVAARVAMSAVLALLVRRTRTGHGGAVSVAQSEVMLAQTPAQIAAFVLAARGVRLQGTSQDAPWGVFPCAGDDEWCVVSVGGDDDWRALCGLLGREDLAADGELAHAAGRVEQRQRIDAAVASWTRGRSAETAMTALQRAGVPAGAMLRVAELPEFGYFRERPLFQSFDQPGVEAPVTVDNRPVRAEHLAVPPLAPAPFPAEHSRAIVRDWLGLSDAEIDQLLAEGVLEAAAPPSS